MPPKNKHGSSDPAASQKWAYIQSGGASAKSDSDSPARAVLKQPPGAGGATALQRNLEQENEANPTVFDKTPLGKMKKKSTDKARAESPSRRVTVSAPGDPKPTAPGSRDAKKREKKTSKARVAASVDTDDSASDTGSTTSDGKRKKKHENIYEGVARDGYLITFSKKCERALRHEIIEEITRSGLSVIPHDVKMGGKKVHCVQVTASEDVIIAIAERTGFLKQLKPIPGDKLPWRYAPFSADMKDMYQRSMVDDALFFSAERLTLIHLVLMSSLKKRLDDKRVVSQFIPIHDYAMVNLITAGTFKLCATNVNRDTNLVREYCGEKNAFFFSFVNYYSRAIFIPGLCGAFAGLTILVCDSVGYNWVNTQIIQPSVSFLYCVWGTTMLAMWRRNQSKIAFRWNTLGIGADDGGHEVRAKYRGKRRRNPVTGEHETYYAPWKRVLFRYPIVATIFTILLGFSLVIGVSLYALRDNDEEGGEAMAFAGATYGVVCYLVNYVYKIIAKAITNFENHRTQFDWDRSYVFKTFWFQLITSFSFMFYAIFFKDVVALLPFIPEYFKGPSCIFQQNIDQRGVCMRDLRMLLTMQYWMHMISSLAMELILPVLWSKTINLFLKGKVDKWKKYAKRNWKNSGLDGVPLSKGFGWRLKVLAKRGVPAQSMMRKWNVNDEYANFAIQFAYTTLFISAAPFLTITSSIFFALWIPIMVFKTALLCQRDPPEKVDSIGYWFEMLNIVALIAIFTNSSLISMVMFAVPFGMPRTVMNSIFYFLALEHVLLLMKLALSILLRGNDPRVNKWQKIQDYEAEIGVQNAIASYRATAEEEGIAGEWDDDGNFVKKESKDEKPSKEGGNDDDDAGETDALLGGKKKEKSGKFLGLF